MQKLSEAWAGRSFIVENRPGGDGVIALEALVKTAPDGYTLYGGGSSIVTAWPTKRIAFDPRTALDPVAQMSSQAYILLVNPSLPVKSVGELVALGRKKPGALSYASSGNGSAAHLGMEFFKSKAQIQMVHIPYKGNGQAIIDLISGQVQLMFSGPNGGAPHIRSGKVRPIAVTSIKRIGAYPNLPTLSESGISGLARFELDGFHGLFAPAGVHPSILLALNRDIVKIMNSQDMKDRLAADGSEAPDPQSPQEFKNKFAEKISQWDAFIRASGIKLSDN
jgi:tripartite-type tricarboxylate transporter receptor subunit TctC